MLPSHVLQAYCQGSMLKSLFQDTRASVENAFLLLYCSEMFSNIHEDNSGRIMQEEHIKTLQKNHINNNMSHILAKRGVSLYHII